MALSLGATTAHPVSKDPSERMFLFKQIILEISQVLLWRKKFMFKTTLSHETCLVTHTQANKKSLGLRPPSRVSHKLRVLHNSHVLKTMVHVEKGHCISLGHFPDLKLFPV